MNNNDNEDIINKQREQYKKLVLEQVIQFCCSCSCDDDNNNKYDDDDDDDNETYRLDTIRWMRQCIRSSDNRQSLRIRACGGNTNFCYKIDVVDVPLKEEWDEENEQQHSPVCTKRRGAALFAKLSSKYALWNPDHSASYDLQRTDNEYYLLKHFSSCGNNHHAICVQPYFCTSIMVPKQVEEEVDGSCHSVTTLDTEMKLLVTEWATGVDRPFSYQFVDGRVDRHVVTNVAKAFAAIHVCYASCENENGSTDNNNNNHDCDTTDYDTSRRMAQLPLQQLHLHPDFNTSVRPCSWSFFSVMTKRFQELICIHHCPNQQQQQLDGMDQTNRVLVEDDDDEDPCIVRAREMGWITFQSIVDTMERDFNRRQTLIHSDAHTWNILVEKTTVEKEATLATRTCEAEAQVGARFYLCDWEMAMVGPMGRDPGFFQAWPVVCAMAHAMHDGHQTIAKDILTLATEHFWDTYATTLHVESKRKQQQQNDRGNHQHHPMTVTTTNETNTNANAIDDDNKDDEEQQQLLCETFRDAMGWNGYILFAGYYLFEIKFEELHPLLAGLTTKQRKLFKGVVGYIGLQLLQWGFFNQEEESQQQQQQSHSMTLLDWRMAQRTLFREQVDRLFQAAVAVSK